MLAVLLERLTFFGVRLCVAEPEKLRSLVCLRFFCDLHTCLKQKQGTSFPVIALTHVCCVSKEADVTGI